MINGACYAITAPCFGILCDNSFNPNAINFLGAVLIVVSFTFIGPAPFLPFLPTHLWVSILCLVLHGAGIGALLVSSFSSAHSQAVKNGFPDSIDTYGVISGLWTSVFAFGAFLGNGRNLDL